MKSTAIAIVGMAGRFPGARTVAQFWQNLRDGVESIRDCTDAELRAAGATADELANPAYVKRTSLLDDVPLFDAAFFGLSPRDASIMDPQHRHFLECAWEALEDAAYPPQRFQGSIGVFAGSGLNTYLIHHLLANRRMREEAGLFQLKQTGNDKDVLATRVSYQFDLRGPSINVQTACSTSLVAVHLACQTLLDCACDMALAGGVTIEVPHGLGYLYREGEILSRDGHCRSFDASSSGTVFGNGVGIVVLRRLEDALEAGDNIRAIILGSAINNDGARKVGYLAPSVEGQIEVIEEALEFAGVRADEISYVEAHGTGTIVGDPIELRALTQAFQKSAGKPSHCAIGSVKSNVGHLDAAAGVTGLIKTVLALEHRKLPPTLHFKAINPRIDLTGTPFFVNDKLLNWPSSGSPRRAGVTSLGIGGTNVHVVLEEPPQPHLSRRAKPSELLTVSAKSEAAADRALANLVAHLKAHPELDPADVAFTCQLGRQAFPHRRALVVDNNPDAIATLPEAAAKIGAAGVAARTQPRIVFLFSGQGAQYVNMGRELYNNEPVFRDTLDRCASLLKPHIGIDLVEALYPADQEKDTATERLNETWLTQPALFSIEYSLAQWWMSLGIEPAAMVGHSIGEYVAACLAGVFSLEDALRVVALRGRLIYNLPTGAMLAVPLPADKLKLPPSLSLAAINNPELSVVSGPIADIAALEASLSGQSIPCRRLHTSHAFHSAMMDPVLATFEDQFRGIELHAPTRPCLSNVSGTWIKPEEATDPAYWARHIRQTVRFSDCLAKLLHSPEQILLEAGPGNTLTSLARSQGGRTVKAFQSLPHPRENVSALRCALQALGQLWVAGSEIDWAKLHATNSVRRLSLPTYPFEHQRFWVEPDRVASAPSPDLTAAASLPVHAGPHFYRRSWKPAPLSASSVHESVSTVIFLDRIGLGERIASQLRRNNQQVILVEEGSRFKRIKSRHYMMRPGMREDYDSLLSDLRRTGEAPDSFLHLWSVTSPGNALSLEKTLELSFYSPLFLAQAMAGADIAHANVLFVSNGLQSIDGEPVHDPARAVLFGPAGVLPKELPGIRAASIDFDLEKSGIDVCATQLIAEIGAAHEGVVAYRQGNRFIETNVECDLAHVPERPRLEQSGVYLITGGLGGIGLTLAEHLAREFKASLILVSRSGAPPEADWESLVNDPRQPEERKTTLRKLMEIRSRCGGLMVAQADVANLAQMRAVIERARTQFGKIDGVFHAAGVLEDAPLLSKTPQSAARVLDPKVRGTLVLEQALGDAPLHFFVLFSSISSVQPPAGQVDYAAANAFLDAFARSRGGPVTVVNWDAWSDVGMAARSTVRHPFLQQRLLRTPNEMVMQSSFSMKQQWLLSEHRLKTGKALIPGTGYLELAAGTLADAVRNGPIEFRDVFFLSPFAVTETESQQVRVRIQRENDSGAKDFFKFSVSAHDSQGAKDGLWVEHATGRIAHRPETSNATVDRKGILDRCTQREILFDADHRTKQERFFDFGPRWRSLKRMHVGYNEGCAEIEIDPRFIAECANFHMHPALLDLATGCSLYLLENYDSSDDLYLPLSYKKIDIHHPLPGRFFSQMRSRPENQARGDVASFDITLFDENDSVLVEIEGFAMRRISDPLRLASQDGQSAQASAYFKDESFDWACISPQEGVRALTRILLSQAPSALIVTNRQIDNAPQSAPLSEAVPSHRPSAQPSASQTLDVEETLRGWFEDLLGIERVELDDDFFALGGHSLIGVRLFAKIRSTYQVELELAALFESRTVRSLAERIRKVRQPVAAQTPSGPACLVPIQPNGSKTPFFFIHAVGGEVLFYEPLARALGPDQPVYAFQSPLANRDDMLTTSVEELASTYVRELRSAFPHGPYFLGGLSYGGLVAFEMAHQLLAQGIEPGLLVMIDAVVPGSVKRIPREEQLSALWQNLRQQRASYLMRKAALKYEYLRRVGLNRTQRIVGDAYRALHRRLPVRLRYAWMEDVHGQALKRYVFRPYDGRVILIRASERGVDGVVSLSERDDPTLGWSSLALGGLDIHDVEAHHMTILLEPRVRKVGEILTGILQQTETTPAQETVSVA